MKKIKIQCPECKGTGIYVGMAEHDGYGVVCHKCYGKGWIIFEYNEFTKRSRRQGITMVLKRNPGICVGKRIGFNFGGMPYKDWFNDKPFPKGSEMRQFTCPYWWTAQEFKLEKCMQDAGAAYSSCAHFANKELCWQEYDKIKGIRNESGR